MSSTVARRSVQAPSPCRVDTEPKVERRAPTPSGNHHGIDVQASLIGIEGVHIAGGGHPAHTVPIGCTAAKACRLHEVLDLDGAVGVQIRTGRSCRGCCPWCLPGRCRRHKLHSCNPRTCSCRHTRPQGRSSHRGVDATTARAEFAGSVGRVGKRIVIARTGIRAAFHNEVAAVVQQTIAFTIEGQQGRCSSRRRLAVPVKVACSRIHAAHHAGRSCHRCCGGGLKLHAPGMVHPLKMHCPLSLWRWDRSCKRLRPNIRATREVRVAPAKWHWGQSHMPRHATGAHTVVASSLNCAAASKFTFDGTLHPKDTQLVDSPGPPHTPQASGCVQLATGSASSTRREFVVARHVNRWPWGHRCRQKEGCTPIRSGS